MNIFPHLEVQIVTTTVPPFNFWHIWSRQTRILFEFYCFATTANKTGMKEG